MSYILEALKRSQHERELGQVPRLQTPLREDPLPVPNPRPWLLAAVALAAVAVLLALYAALHPNGRGDGADAAPAALRPAASPVVSAGGAAPAGPEGMAVAVADPAPPVAPSPPPGPADTPAGGADVGVTAARADALAELIADAEAVSPPAPQTTPGAAPLPVADAAPPVTPPSNSARVDEGSPRSAEPEVLIVPAPPRPGQVLPRGADELRRAVLGPDADDEPRAAGRARPDAPPEPANAPVPEDLLADIRAFKRQLGAPPATGKASGKPALPELPPLTIPDAIRAPAPVAAADTAPPPSANLRGRLPTFSMTVHVYNADPDQRFVFINGKKLRERERTPEGLQVEQVQAEGVVLSYEGERFFKAR